jgi:hypothetical protein
MQQGKTVVALSFRERGLSLGPLEVKLLFLRYEFDFGGFGTCAVDSPEEADDSAVI